MKKIQKHNIMKPLKGKIKKQKFIGFDIETEGTDNIFVSCAIWSKDEQLFFKDKEKVIEYMTSISNSGVTFVATNLSFDFTGIYWNHELWNKHFIIFRGSRIMLAEYKHKNKRAKTQYLDTMNYAPFSVKKLGSIIGVEKLDAPKWLGERKPITPEEWKEYKEYNMQDAKISCLFMEYLQDSINSLGGNLRISAASTALDLYRREYLPRSIIKEQHYVENVKDFIFEGYYGGRTEAISRGRIKNMNYYDVNSLYPSVMLNKYPLPNSIKNVRVPSLENIHMYEGVTECLVTCPYMKYPLLPLRRDAKLLFPTGNFKGIWNNVELRKALELGYKLIPTKQIIYSKTFHPFNGYVTDLYNKRLIEKKKKSPMELVIKLMLNGLYGKFAQKNLEHYEIKDFELLNKKERDKILFKSNDLAIDLLDGKYIYNKDKVSDGVFSLPILSSYTTSYARLLLYEYIEKNEPVYMDTDSIITRKTIETSIDLGKMKLEKYLNSAVIIRPKLYLTDENILPHKYILKYKPLKDENTEITIDKPILSPIHFITDFQVKAKGVKRPNIEDFDNILKHKEVEKMRFMTIKSGLRRGILPNSILYETKTLDLEDTKRQWSKQFNSNELQDSEPLLIMEHM